MHTLLNVTNAKVCASRVDGKSFFASKSGSTTAESSICGRKAIDSRRIEAGRREAEAGRDEER